MGKITLKGFKCERCKHKWFPRNNKRNPIVCPKCKSPYWDKPRRRKR
jgi:predicted Zn-ribbon and HTH transcriptional regulator